MNERSKHHYLPVDDRAAAWGFYVTTAGRVLERVSGALPYGVHPEMYDYDYSAVPRSEALTKSPRASGRVLPEFGVIYLTETHAVFESDPTGVVEFDGPTLLFLFPGVWHRYRPVAGAKDWMTCRWFNFNGEIAYRLMRREFVTPGTAVRPAARPRRLAAAFDHFVERVAAHPAGDAMLLSMRALELLASCLESARDGSGGNAEDGGPTVGDDLVERVLDLIWTGSHREFSIEQLCESVGANRRTVERRFRAAQGHSLLTEVNRCRCRRARHLLEATELPIKNICWLAGFSNLGQMRLTFLHHEGMTPSAYRRSGQNAKSPAG